MGILSVLLPKAQGKIIDDQIYPFHSFHSACFHFCLTSVCLTSRVCGCMNSESRNSWQGNELDSKKERLLPLRAVIKGFYIWQSTETGVTRHFTESRLARAEWGVRRSRPLVKFYHWVSPSYVLVLKWWNEEKTQNTFKPGLGFSGRKIYVSGDKKIYEVF